MQEETISISLELRFAGDTLSGRATDGTGKGREFTGWIGLVAAIDALSASHDGPHHETKENHSMRTDTIGSDLGRVVRPGDEGWDEARGGFNLLVDQRPEMVAFPADEGEVAAVVRYARDNGLRVAPQLTGHNAAPLGSLEGTVVLNTAGLQGVEIDPAARRARVRAGATWADVSDPAGEHGLAGLAGSSRTVGVAGYHVGGGLSFLGRKHGLACNSVTAIELVTADGEQRRVDAETDADLFWALRGGGGNFGVVTALELELYPAPEVYAGTLFFPLEQAAEVLHAWRELTAGLPEDITTVGRILRFPPLPEVPEPVRGKSFATVGAIFLGSEADGAELIRPLRELGPAMDTVAAIPPAALGYVHMDPEDPMPYLSTHSMTGELPAKAIDDMVAVAGDGSGSMLAAVELRHAGGALARREPDAGALAALPGEFLMFAVGGVMEEAHAPIVESQLAAVDEVFAPYASGRYLNFTEQQVERGSFHDPETLARLEAIKRAADPDGMFRGNHEVG